MENPYSVGSIVYPSHRPQHYGRVIEICDVGSTHMGMFPERELPGEFCKVLWKGGEISVHWHLDLNSLTELLESTERKANTHRANVEKARAL